jgi:hypothetical protein
MKRTTRRKGTKKRVPYQVAHWNKSPVLVYVKVSRVFDFTFRPLVSAEKRDGHTA